MSETFLGCLTDQSLNACLVERIGTDGVILILMAMIVVPFLLIAWFFPNAWGKRDPSGIVPSNFESGEVDCD